MSEQTPSVGRQSTTWFGGPVASLPETAAAARAPAAPIATARHSCLGCDRSFEVHAYTGADVDGLNHTLSTLMAQHEQDDHRP